MSHSATRWTNVLVATALLAGWCQPAWSDDEEPQQTQEELPAPLPDVSELPPPTIVPSDPEPLFTIPAALHDPAFQSFVDLNLLGQAYLDNDAELIVDVGLQLLEGERVLLRSHRGLEAMAVLDIGLRLAADQGQMETIDRLSKLAERLGNAEFTEKLELARQLAAQPRAIAPEIPVPSDEVPSDVVIALQTQLDQLERARALGDVAELQELQAELAASETDVPLQAYLQQQVDETLANLPADEGDPDELLEVLGDLSGASRNTGRIFLERMTNGAVFEDAKPFRLRKTDTGEIFIIDPDAPVGNGVNEWIDQASYYGLAGRYGTVYVNLDWKEELQTDAKGKVVVKDGKEQGRGVYWKVDDGNPHFVWVAAWNRVDQRWDMEPKEFKLAFGLKFRGGPHTLNGSALIADAVGGGVDPARIVAAGGGNFSWNQIVAAGGGNITFDRIVAAGGGNLRLTLNIGIPESIARNLNPNGSTVAEIVAADGGHITPNSIVAAGGGNMRPVPPSDAIRVPPTALMVMWSEISERSLELDGTRWLIGQDGASLVGQDGASLIGVGVGSFGNRIARYGVQSIGNDKYFSGARKY
jgi:hypothetical protein